MTLSRQAAFAPIGEIVAQQVLPRLRHARRLPLHISCVGTATYEVGGDAEVLAARLSSANAHLPRNP